VQSKINTIKERKDYSAATIIGSWVLVLATLVSNFTHDERRAKAQAFINPVKPVYVYVHADNQPVSRIDNENETVHMPTKFDIGLKMNAVSGKK
jgi:hypothetical protein